VEICGLKVKLCFVSISGAQVPVFQMGWGLGGAERPAELDLPFTPYPAVCQRFGPSETTTAVPAFPLFASQVSYHCEHDVVGLKKCMGLDLFAGRVPGLGRRMIRFPSARRFALSREEKAFGELWRGGVVGLLRAALVSWQPRALLQRSSQKLLPVVRAVALPMTKNTLF